MPRPDPREPSLAYEIGFSILKYRGQTPILAVCVRCDLKFFTPSEVMKDDEAAGQYLLMKFLGHRCAATFPHDENERTLRIQKNCAVRNQPMNVNE